MAQKTLTTSLVLRGKVDATYNAVTKALTEFGDLTKGISDQLINFGKESSDVYQTYERSMAGARQALESQYGAGFQDINVEVQNIDQVMNLLNQKAAEWAASSIFHTNDVAAAISDAAHAGWNLDQILTGIPAAMRLAEAGGLSLAESTKYLSIIAAASGTEFSDLDKLIDSWSFTAMNSVGDIRSFGDAMQRMGPTMRFVGGDMNQLIAMLGLLHSAGMEGAQAGTIMRNMMVRLIAPTDKASEAMAALGLSAEDIDSEFEDGGMDAAADAIETLGLQVYDEEGNLRSFIDIMTDLKKALDGLTDAEANPLLAAIFPTRTITGARALLDNIEGLQTAYGLLTGGNAEGFSAYISGIMMDTQYGDVEILMSKWEELQRTIGQLLTEDVREGAQILSGLLASVAGTDPAVLSSIIGALEGFVLVSAGAGAVGAGLTWLRTFLGFLATPGGALIGGAAALAVIVGALKKFDEIKNTEAFGDLTIGEENLRQALAHIREPFNEARKDLDAYNAAMDQAVSSYTDSSSRLASTLLTHMVTGKTLSPEEIESIQGVGEEMIRAFMQGMDAGHAAGMEAWNLTGAAAEDPSLFGTVTNLMTLGFENATLQAQTLSQNLRDAITSGFADGSLTAEETANIQNVMRQMNDLLSVTTQGAAYAAQSEAMRKAQTLGLAGAKDALETISTARKTALDDYWASGDQSIGLTRAYMEYMQRSGIKWLDEYGYLGPAGESVLLTPENIDTVIAGMTEAYRAQETGVRAGYDEMERRVIEALISGVDDGGLYHFWETNIRGKTGEEATAATSAWANGMSLGNLQAVTQQLGLLNRLGLNGAEQYLDTDAWSGFKSWVTSSYGITDTLVRASLGEKSKNEETLGEYVWGLFGEQPTIEFQPDEESAETAATTAVQTAQEYADEHPVLVTFNASDGSNMDIPEAFAGQIPGMADGGRTTEPAIFGEAGPEWFIPERHDAGTAALLIAAARASGFSMAELAVMSRARLFADGGTTSLGWSSMPAAASSVTQVHYSPVIHSDNPGAISEALREDKERFRRLLREELENRALYAEVTGYR